MKKNRLVWKSRPSVCHLVSVIKPCIGLELISVKGSLSTRCRSVNLVMISAIAVTLLFRSWMNFDPYSPYFLTDLDWIRYERSTHAATEHYWVSWEKLRRKIYLRIFYIYSPIWIKFSAGDVYKNLSSKGEFDENQRWPYFAYGCTIISIHSSYIFCPIGLKFVISDLYVVQWNILEFNENRRREGRAFMTGVNEIAFTRVRSKDMTVWKQRMP